MNHQTFNITQMNFFSIKNIGFTLISGMLFMQACAPKPANTPIQTQSAEIIDRTRPPVPGPAPTINIPDAVSYTLPNGLQLYVVSNSKLPLVSATLTVDGKPQVYGNKAGLTEMAGDLFRRGTASLDKAALDERVDFLGASLSTSAYGASVSSLKRNFPEILQLMADVALRPALNSEELEKVRTQTLSNLASGKEDPARISANISRALTYGKNHPYGEITTEETVKNISREDIRNFYNTWWKPNISYLVMVGDITPEEAHRLAVENFGHWERASVPNVNVPLPEKPAKTYIAIVNRPGAVQSNIEIVSPLDLKPASADRIAATFAGNILGTGFSSRLNQNLREGKGFTYSASGGISSDRYAGRFRGAASVRKEKTDSAIAEFLNEFNRIRVEPVGKEELDAMKAYVGGSFARSLEQPSTIAAFALNTVLNNLPKDYYKNYLKNLQAVTPAQVTANSLKYIPVNNLVITVVGDAAEIAPGLEKYGEVKYFDIYGNPAEPPKVEKADASVTAESILQKAINGYGGMANLEKIRDIEIDGSASIMGQQLTYNQKIARPDKLVVSIKAGPINLMRQVKNGDQYISIQQGSNTPVDEATKHELNAKAGIFEELYWKNTRGYKFDVVGTEKMDGKEAYKMKITSPGGNEFFSFFDQESGRRLKDVRTQDMGAIGAMVINTFFYDYTLYEGIYLPAKVTVDLGVAKQDVTIREVKINKGLKDSDFK